MEAGLLTSLSSVTLETPRTSPVGANVFAAREFVEACARNLGSRYRARQIPVSDSGPDRLFYALETAEPLGLRSYSLAPCGLHANPGWEQKLLRSTLEGIVNRLTGIRVRKFGWKVLFDSADLADGLTSLGLSFRMDPTQVLHLSNDYDRVFAGYSSSIRNQVRKARSRGVTVRDAKDEDTVRAYYKVHTELAENKGGYPFIYPLSLFLDLVQLSFTRLLVAEHDGQVVGGGLFFKEESSVIYWHGATDRTYSSHFPSRLIFDEAIRAACQSGARFLNFGGSAGIVSLERFKESWGAKVEHNWNFEWKNPFWALLTRLKQRDFAESRSERPPGTAGAGVSENSDRLE